MGVRVARCEFGTFGVRVGTTLPLPPATKPDQVPDATVREHPGRSPRRSETGTRLPGNRVRIVSVPATSGRWGTFNTARQRRRRGVHSRLSDKIQTGP